MKMFLETKQSLTGPAPGSFLGDEKGFGDLGAGLGTRHWPASRRIKQPATVSSHSILQGCIFFRRARSFKVVFVFSVAGFGLTAAHHLRRNGFGFGLTHGLQSSLAAAVKPKPKPRRQIDRRATHHLQLQSNLEWCYSG